MSTSLDGLPNKALYTPREVASFFGVTPRTVYVWVETGRLEGLKIADRTLRIPRQAVVEIIILSRTSNE